MDDLDQGCPSAFAAFLLVFLEQLGKVEIGAEFSRLFSFIGMSTIRQLTRLTTASIGTFREEVYIAPGRGIGLQICTIHFYSSICQTFTISR